MTQSDEPAENRGAPIGHDWDDAFRNGAYIPGSDALPARWAAEAASFRSTQRFETLSYGDDVRQQLDIVWPAASPSGLMVFVHGGYWMQTSKDDWTHYAAGALRHGWAVAFPSYRLAPHVRLTGIVADIGAAIATAATQVAGPISICGHSAGGHLAARMICTDSPLPAAILDRIAHVVPISGVHDLRPLLYTQMNTTLRIDPEEAAAQSPALLAPLPHVRVTPWVGGDERPEFIRQSQILSLNWSSPDREIATTIDGGQDHFSVLEGLGDPTSALVRTLLDTPIKREVRP